MVIGPDKQSIQKMKGLSRQIVFLLSQQKYLFWVLIKRASVCLFVCVEVLQPSQFIGVMSSTVSYLATFFTGQASSSKRLNSIVQILLPDTDNCPS